MYGSEVRTKENEYRIQDVDETVATLKYYGYLDEEGNWLIIRENTSVTNIAAYRFARATYATPGGYSGAWTSRANLHYGYWNESF